MSDQATRNLGYRFDFIRTVNELEVRQKPILKEIMNLIRKLFLFIIISSKGYVQFEKTKVDTINVYSINVYNSNGNWKDAEKVSIENLLKNPNKYNRKLISVYGCISLRPNKLNKIYRSKESFEEQKNEDAVFYAQFTEDTYFVMRKFKEGYATIIGSFSMVDNAECNGMVYQIRRIDIPK